MDAAEVVLAVGDEAVVVAVVVVAIVVTDVVVAPLSHVTIPLKNGHLSMPHKWPLSATPVLSHDT
jgi:hypothetical protein